MEEEGREGYLSLGRSVGRRKVEEGRREGPKIEEEKKKEGRPL